MASCVQTTSLLAQQRIRDSSNQELAAGIETANLRASRLMPSSTLQIPSIHR